MIYYRSAAIEDNQQLLDLTSSTGMSGKISLRIDRNPNFFELLKFRGKSRVIVATDNNTIVGSICVSLEQTYIGGKVYPLYYISDFKVSHNYRNRGIGLELTNEVAKYVEIENGDFAFLNVSEGNRRPFVFFSNRSRYPDFENIGSFKIFQFIGSKSTRFNSNYKVELAEANEEVIRFLNAYYSKHELANVITKQKLEETVIYCVRNKGVIIAVMCLFDTMKMKQNVVLKLPWLLHYSIKFLNRFSKILGLSKMPTNNEPIKMLYIKYFAITNYNKELIASLVKQAKNDAYNKSYSFVKKGCKNW